MASLILNNNRNKRSLVHNPKRQKGIDILLQLIATSDALVSNMRSGAMRRLALRHEDIIKANEKRCQVYLSALGAELSDSWQTDIDELVPKLVGASWSASRYRLLGVKKEPNLRSKTAALDAKGRLFVLYAWMRSEWHCSRPAERLCRKRRLGHERQRRAPYFNRSWGLPLKKRRN